MLQYRQSAGAGMRQFIPGSYWRGTHLLCSPPSLQSGYLRSRRSESLPTNHAECDLPARLRHTSGTVTGVPLYDFLTSPQGGGGLVLDYSPVTPRPNRFFLGEIFTEHSLGTFIEIPATIRYLHDDFQSCTRRPSAPPAAPFRQWHLSALSLAKMTANGTIRASHLPFEKEGLASFI